MSISGARVDPGPLCHDAAVTEDSTVIITYPAHQILESALFWSGKMPPISPPTKRTTALVWATPLLLLPPGWGTLLSATRYFCFGMTRGHMGAGGLEMQKGMIPCCPLQSEEGTTLCLATQSLWHWINCHPATLAWGQQG